MRKILVVDDEELIRTLVRRTLEANGHTVEEAVNGRQALALYQQHPADLVITDIAMPEMNGLDLLTALTEKYADIKVIAMSGLDENLAVATLLGACETVQKPFNLDELMRMVSTHLAHTVAA
jgi:DNA-binding NtrC family response regulator